MKHSISALIHAIPEFSHKERTLLRKCLDEVDDFSKVCDLIEPLQENSRHCPHCESHRVHKHGLSAGLQRYKCVSCGKTFNALTKTPLAHLRKKDKWLSQLNCMLQSKTIRESKKELQVNIKTAFLWRHRFASWLNKDTPSKLSGIIEADETYYRYSEKGSRKLDRKPRKRGADQKVRGLSNKQVCVFVACDRSNKDIELVTGHGAVKSDWLEKNITAKIAKDAVLVTDGLIAYKSFCLKKNITHTVVKNRPGMRTKGTYHIQHVNSYHSRLRAWITFHFHGVATKYLENYLAWRHEIENSKINSPEMLFKVAVGYFPQLSGT